MINLGEPQLINLGKPQLINLGKPQLINLGKPQLINLGKPQFINLGKPQLIKLRKSQFINLGKPQFINLGKPQLISPLSLIRKKLKSTVNRTCPFKTVKTIKNVLIFPGPSRELFDKSSTDNSLQYSNQTIHMTMSY